MSTTRLEQLILLEKTNPSDPFLKYARALELIKLNREQEAIEVFGLLATDFSDYAPAYYHYGKLLEKLERYDEAEKIYNVGIEKATKAGDAHMNYELKQALSLLKMDEDF